MDKQDLIKLAEGYLARSPGNRISEEIAISKEVAGLKLFEEPILAFGSAKDESFYALKKPEAIGEHFMLPEEWLPGAKTVISVFLPFTEEVKSSNRTNRTWPSDGWLHARIEGQQLLNNLCFYLKDELSKDGYPSIVPSAEERFWSNTDSSGRKETFTSNWSERHAAFICGHGTFGLSKGLITRKGVAGRFGSIITALALEPDNRQYTGIYEYCSGCGLCADNCPVSAISLESGKDHKPCSDFLEETKAKHITRYACGKCQVCVPCESGIPGRR